jgi:hypothetical protein
MVTPKATQGVMTEPISTTTPHQPIAPNTTTIGKTLVNNKSSPPRTLRNRNRTDTTTNATSVPKPSIKPSSRLRRALKMIGTAPV